LSALLTFSLFPLSVSVNIQKAKTFQDKTLLSVGVEDFFLHKAEETKNATLKNRLALLHSSISSLLQQMFLASDVMGPYTTYCERYPLKMFLPWAFSWGRHLLERYLNKIEKYSRYSCDAIAVASSTNPECISLTVTPVNELYQGSSNGKSNKKDNQNQDKFLMMINEKLLLTRHQHSKERNDDDNPSSSSSGISLMSSCLFKETKSHIKSM
jgi:hypothetical protein